MTKVPFTIRNGIYNSRTINNNLPKETRSAIYIVLGRLVTKNVIEGRWTSLFEELCRSCRIDFDHAEIRNYDTEFKERLYNADWKGVFIFLERIYNSYFEDSHAYDINGNSTDLLLSKDDAMKTYTDEINNILLEDNIDYEFTDGEFYRRGRSITKKNVEHVGAVLSDPTLHKVRSLYNKALKFFRDTKAPDYENAIKESFCALELSGEIITGKKISRDFTNEFRKLSGNEEGKIPPPIVEGLIKFYGYRNNGKGVSHGADKGLRVSKYEAEMILNFIAIIITYLYDYFSSIKDEEVPF